VKEGGFRFVQNEAAIAKAKKNLGDKFDSAIRRGETDKVMEIVNQYTEQYGDPRPLFRGMKMDALKLFLTMDQQMLLRAKTPSSVQKYQRYKEIMQGVQQDN
jgi:hypothetical protein